MCKVIRSSRLSLRILLLFLVLESFLTTGSGNTQNHLSYQVGASGDAASKANLGVMVQIRTYAYDISNPNAPLRLDYFWVGSVLANGAFIQFGYTLEAGYYCLRGLWKSGAFICTGESDLIPIGDARWEWQYWPASDGADYYYGTGESMSAGLNGTWHRYAMYPGLNGSWSFHFDENNVANVSFAAVLSKTPVFVIAEQGTTASLARLGPVEFRNISYLTTNGWRPVKSLVAQVGCGANTPCTVPNPYGVSVVGPNDILAGSGMEKHRDGELIWPQPSFLDSHIGEILVLEFVAILGLYVLSRHKRNRRKSS